MQEVENVGFGGHACIERQLDRTEHGLLIMLENKRQDLGHLRSPPTRHRRWPCNRRNASGIVTNGAPLRKAPGLRWIPAR